MNFDFNGFKLLVILVLLVTACSPSTEEDRLMLLCNVERVNDRFVFPHVRVLGHSLSVGSEMQPGDDLGKYGVRLPGRENVSYPKQLIAVFGVTSKSATLKEQLELIETLAVNDGRVVGTGQTLEVFEASLK